MPAPCALIMGCNLRDLANAEDTTMDAMKGKKVGIDSFLLAFQFLTTIATVLLPEMEARCEPIMARLSHT